MLCRVQARFQAFTSLLVVSILAGGTDAVVQGYFWLYIRLQAWDSRLALGLFKYMYSYTIFVFLFLTYFTLYNRL